MEPQSRRSQSSPRGGRPSWLLPVLIPLITLIVVGAGLGTLFAVKSGDGRRTAGELTTVTAPPTSLTLASSTTEGATTTVTESTTSTAAPQTSTTGPATETTLNGATGPWQTSPASLADLNSQLVQGLPAGQTIYLPDHLPKGWAIAAPGQAFGDIVNGYFTDMHTNPSITRLEGDTTQPGEYVVAFTDGKEVVVEMVVIGDWGEMEFGEVTAYGKQLYVYADDSMVAVLVPGWELGTLVASPGAREAALEIAAAIRAW